MLKAYASARRWLVRYRLKGSGAERARFFRFVAAGGFAAVVNVASRWALEFIMPYEAAVALAYLFGMTVAFVLTRRFVFDVSGGCVQGQYVRFALVNATAFAQVWLVSVGLARVFFPASGFTWHPETVAHIIGVTSPLVTSYYGHKIYSFGRR